MLLDVEFKLKRFRIFSVDMILGKDINFDISWKRRKKLVIIGRSDKDMYINARKHRGKDMFMNTRQLSERERERARERERERYDLSHKKKSVKINIGRVEVLRIFS